MRQAVTIALCLSCALVIAGCNKGPSNSQIDKTLKDVNVIDETNLNEVMLQSADPDEAVSYFQRASAQYPDRIDFKRGLATSLVRAKKPNAAAAAWADVLAMPAATLDDRVDYADALIRSNEWDKAAAELNKIPPTHETFKRYRLEAMVADSKKQWKKADSFYDIAVGLTTKPSGTLNNWGFSKLTRGDYAGAEKLFGEALVYEPSLFTAKNNLVLARAAQHNYDMPVVEMTQTERAELLYTAALAAIKQGDVTIGKGLLQQAIDTHPQYFEAAVRSLNALDSKQN